MSTPAPETHLDFIRDRAQDGYDQARAWMRSYANALAENAIVGNLTSANHVHGLVEAEYRAHAWGALLTRLRHTDVRNAVELTRDALLVDPLAVDPHERPRALAAAMGWIRAKARAGMVFELGQLLIDIDFDDAKHAEAAERARRQATWAVASE